MNIIEKAFQFALHKHEGQYRKGTKIPYITHPFAVAMLLKHHGYSDEIVAAGLLHDTLEDTNTTEEELLGEFGPFVLDLVQAASEPDKSQSWEERKLRMLRDLPNKTPDQLAVIVADKLHNLRSIQADSEAIGDAVWTRFNRGKREQSWNYMSVVNALIPFHKEVRLIRILDVEVKRLFLGTGKLTTKEIDAVFGAVYYLSKATEDELAEMGMLDFVREVKVDAENLYRHADFELLSPLMDDFVDRGIQFEMNSDGTFILLAFCHELQQRLGWQRDELYRHFKRNLARL